MSSAIAAGSENNFGIKLAFDHKEIVEYARERLRGKLEYTNLAFSLLPEKFTFSELQGVYEAIFGKKFDKRNFRKKIARLELVKPTKELVKQGRAEVDLEKRRKIYQTLYRTAHDEAIWLFVHAQDELWAKRRDVSWQPFNITGSKALVYYFQVPGGR